MHPDPPDPGVPPARTPSRGELLEILRTELRSVSDDIPDELPSDRALEEDLGIDSLDTIEFVARVEYRYHVLVPDEHWQRLTTLDAIADYMIDRLADV